MPEGFKAGSIIAELTLDKDKWTASVKEVTADTDKLKKSASSWGEGVTKVGMAFTAAGAVAAGSLLAMIKSTANVGDQINDLSMRLGISTETLSSYRLIADKTGSSLEGVARGLKGLAANMVEAAKGTGEGAKAFEELKLKSTDSAGNLKDLDTMMEEVADRFAQMADGAVKNTLAVKLFGKAGMELIPMLNQGGEALRQNRAEAERLGMVFSKQAAMASDEFNDRLTDLKYGLGGTAKELAMTMMPAVTGFIKNITDTVVKVREWAAAHPELTKTIVGLGLKVALLLAALGPVLIIIPKIVSVTKGWIGHIKEMPGLITSAISRIGAMSAGTFASIGIWTAAAAAIGFYVIKLQEKKQAEDYAADATERAKEASERLKKKLEEAMKQAGMSAGAIAELEKKYYDAAQGQESWTAAMGMAIKKGKETKELQESLAKVGKEHAAAIEKQRKETDLFVPSLDSAAEAQQRWTDFLDAAGIVTDTGSKKITELWTWQGRLEEMWTSGKISGEQYSQGVKTITDELGKYGVETNLILPPSRNFADLMKDVPATFDDVVFGFEDLSSAVGYWSTELGISHGDVRQLTYDCVQLQADLMGIKLPTLDFSQIGSASKTATVESKNYFDGLYNDIARGFGDTVQKWAEQGMSLRGVARDLWGNIKSTFFTMVGEMTTGAVLGQFKSLFSGIAKSGEDAVGSATSSIGKAVSGLGTGLAALITTLATAIATAATTLAAAAPAIITVGAIALAMYAGFKLIGSIFGGGKGKQGDVTYWLSFIKDNTQVVRNYLEGGLAADITNTARALCGPIPEKLDSMFNMIDMARNDLKEALWGGPFSSLPEIRDYAKQVAEKIGSLTKAQGGAVIMRPSLVIAGEESPRIPEIILPATDLMNITRPRTALNISLNAVFQIDALDDRSIRDVVRDRIGPEFVDWVQTQLGKTRMKEALGLA